MLVLRGDYHQGSEWFSPGSRGRQCVPICIVFLAMLKIRCLNSWSKNHLHFILQAGDEMYKNIASVKCLPSNYLLLTDLPPYFMLLSRGFSLNSNAAKTRNYSGTLRKELYYCNEFMMSVEFALNLVFNSNIAVMQCIIIFCDCAISVAKCENVFIAFDPHSRCELGLCSENGSCHVSKFDSLNSVCSFLRDLACSLTDTDISHVQYDLHCFELKIMKTNTIKRVKAVDICHLKTSFSCFQQNHQAGPHNVTGHKNIQSTFALGIDQKQKKCHQTYKRKMDANICPSKCKKSKQTGKLFENSSTEMPDMIGCVNDDSASASSIFENTEKVTVCEVQERETNCAQLSHSQTLSNTYSINDIGSKSDINTVHTQIVNKFSHSVSEGPIYVCTSCSQTWFKETVLRVSSVKCSSRLFEKCSSNIKSVHNLEWICLACKKYLELGKIPECSIGNDMKFPVIPPELQGLTKLEERLISPRIPFMSIRQQPRGGQLSMKGNVVNVPADINKTVRLLPRTIDDNDTVFIKLKRRLSYQHTVAQEMVRPNRVLDAVRFLVKTRLFQSEGIDIDPNWSYEMQFNQVDENTEDESLNESDSDSHWTEDGNTENHPSGNTDTVLNPITFREYSKVLNIAPGDGSTPLGLYEDINSEFLSFPAIYCGETRLANNKRSVPVHYSTIVKWEMRNIDRRVAMCIPNLFYKMKKLQIKYIQGKIQIAIRKYKLQGKKITVHDVLAPGAVDNMVKYNEGFQILRQLRGSPAYWEAAKKDLFALIKQLGIPTWFCSLSAAETKWKDLLKTLGKLVDKKEYSVDEINNMSWQKKCYLINSDPVTCSRYFDYKVQRFLHDILLGPAKPLGDIKDYFYRVEFQQRGSPHIHMVAWVKDSPDVANKEQPEKTKIAEFVDQHITCLKDQSIVNLINYQTHRHARTCRKKGKTICRFNYPLPPMPQTAVLSPLVEGDNIERTKCKNNYEKIMEKLNEIKYGSDLEFKDFLKDIDITETDYYNAIRSSLQRDKVFLKRDTSEIRINSYNTLMLKCWQANIDVQFVLDAYSCASYIVSYISKGQRGMSNLMCSALKEAKENSFDLKHQLRHVGNKFLTHVEVGAQEAVYLLLQMPLRRSSRKVLFINTSPKSERLTILKPVSVLEDMDGSSTDIDSDNVIKRYERRPLSLLMLCLADFASWFEFKYPQKSQKKHKATIVSENDELPESDYNENHDDDPEEIPSCDENECTPCELDSYPLNKEYAMPGGGTLIKRKTQKVLRYVKYNKDIDPENYYRELLMLFHPWKKEADIPFSFQLVKTLYDDNKRTIQAKRAMYEQNRKLIDIVESSMHQQNNNDEPVSNSGFMPENEHFEEQDRDEGCSVAEKYGCFDPGIHLNYDVGTDIGITRKQISEDDILFKLPDTEYRKLVQSLNPEQKIFFYHILHWFETKNEPLYNFLSGGAGVGKSVVTRAIYQALIRCFNIEAGSNPDEIKILLCAPTGKAAHNINGNTLHSTFCIPANNGFAYKPLSMEQLNVFRMKYKSLKCIIIDEISMVGCRMLNFINCRLQEIMDVNLSFGGISIISVGDLYQLKPVMDNWVFSNACNEYGIIASNLWQDNFKLFELKTIMRQKEDTQFAEMLNRLREGCHTDEDIVLLKTRIRNDQDSTAILSVPHLFTTCDEVNKFNEKVFNNVTCNSTVVESIDTVIGDLQENLHEKVKNRIPDNPSKTMGLHSTLKLAEGLSVEISINVSVEDGLTNGASGKIKYLDFRIEGSERCSIVWILFDDMNIGKLQRSQHKNLVKASINRNWTPIFEISRKFSLSNNQSYMIQRRQFPLRLASAKTIHKSQGSTMNEVVVDFGKRKNDHIHYVGLSRVKNLAGLHILRLSEHKLSVSDEVIVEMDRMRSNAQLHVCCSTIENSGQEKLNIVFHNARSLHLHIEDVRNEPYISAADVIGISETRFASTDHDIDYALEGFQLLRNDSDSNQRTRPFHGSAVYSRTGFHDIFKGSIQGIEVTCGTVKKGSCHKHVIFIYCSPKISTISNFKIVFEKLSTMCDLSNSVVLGDFNIDIQVEKQIENLMLGFGFKQHIREFTTCYSTTLDHVYSNINTTAAAGVLDCYFSDHKPVFISLLCDV